jgi:hypothetical protein
MRISPETMPRPGTLRYIIETEHAPCAYIKAPRARRKLADRILSHLSAEHRRPDVRNRIVWGLRELAESPTAQGFYRNGVQVVIAWGHPNSPDAFGAVGLSAE